MFFFFSSRRRHTRWTGDWSSDVCSSDLGTGTYTKTIQAASDWFKPGAELLVDLGEVKNLAEVSVNGKPLGILWKTPYRVDRSEERRVGKECRSRWWGNH